MAKLLLPVLSLFLLLGLTFAEWPESPFRTRDISPSRLQSSCQLSSINAQEPTRTIQAEGGLTEFWEVNNEQFRCSGVSMHRHRLQRRSLLLPHYNNAPVLVYVQQGSGMYGITISGCPETFESTQQFEGFGEERGESFRERHQKLEQFRQGDIIAVPAGAANWAYNNGDQELVLVVMTDVSNSVNQLDPFPRSFYLAGNPERAQRQQQQYYGGQQGAGRRGQHENGNVFRGFNVRTLAEVFGVDEQTARNLQGETDERGHIIIVERSLKVIRPPFSREEEYRRRGRPEFGFGRGEEKGYFGGDNGLEETICSARTRENLDRPTRADLYNPRAGRFSTANGFTFPILRFLKLSASRGILYRNAIMAPQWYVNAHSLHYITRGECRMEIVNHRGQAVFDGQVRQGQVVVVPQFYGFVKQAGEQGCEWVSFNTNDNAMINNLSGRISAIRALPADVVSNAYQISREQAERLKFSRRETTLFSGSGRSGRGRSVVG